MPEREGRPRVLQMGPDPAIGGGMAAALRSLLESGLGERYRLDVVPTYRGADPLRRLLVFLAALVRLAIWSLAGRGRIVHVHGTVRGSMYRKSVCVLAARALRRRVVFHVHSGAGDIAAFAGGRDRLSLRLFGAAFAAADVVLAVSAASAAALGRAYGVSGIEVVPNAAPAVPPVERAPTPGEVHCAYLGGFANQVKGGEVLVAALPAALAREPALRLTLAGPGEPPADAAALLAAEPRLEWAGWLGPGEKDALLRGAECFVMPSLSEGMPMALLEAMAYGMAIVATRAGGIPELVEDGVTGLLVEPGDPEALAAALDRLAADPELRRRLAAAARERAQTLDADEVAARLGRIYDALLA
ncbi:MAG: glycosyltransferase family 4 protein [Solirubrobacterales bacterium]